MNQPSRDYDFIFLGAGCAGLSLLVRLLEHPNFASAQILVLEPNAKNSNDRTWCFWEDKPGYFEPLVHHRWNQLQFADQAGPMKLATGNYQYKMIRSADFYAHAFNRLLKDPRVTFQQAAVREVSATHLHLEQGESISRQRAVVFNSIPPKSLPKQPGAHYLLQHFLGWFIETETEYFNPDQAMLMDFRTEQHGYTGFVYTLPLSTQRALVEYTLFSPALLDKPQYEQSLKTYLSAHVLNANPYQITETEFGVIPMTNARFEREQNGMIMLGTAAGQTKASSGYTFQFIQRHSDALIERLVTGKSLVVSPTCWEKRFPWYDATLLNILANQTLPGEAIFSRLYRNNPADRLFRFLDNASSFGEEIQLMHSVQRWTFTKAALQELF